MDKWLEKYRETFDEQFPLMLCRGNTEDEIIKIIQKCIDDGEPYEPELDSEANY
jgi:hypothetical protein